MKRKHVYLVLAYIVALLTVGLSFALPLFLYAREVKMEGSVGGRGLIWKCSSEEPVISGAATWGGDCPRRSGSEQAIGG